MVEDIKVDDLIKCLFSPGYSIGENTGKNIGGEMSKGSVFIIVVVHEDDDSLSWGEASSSPGKELCSGHQRWYLGPRG